MLPLLALSLCQPDPSACAAAKKTEDIVSCLVASAAKACPDANPSAVTVALMNLAIVSPITLELRPAACNRPVPAAKLPLEDWAQAVASFTRETLPGGLCGKDGQFETWMRDDFREGMAALVQQGNVTGCLLVAAMAADTHAFVKYRGAGTFVDTEHHACAFSY